MHILHFNNKEQRMLILLFLWPKNPFVRNFPRFLMSTVFVPWAEYLERKVRFYKKLWFSTDPDQVCDCPVIGSANKNTKIIVRVAQTLLLFLLTSAWVKNHSKLWLMWSHSIADNQRWAFYRKDLFYFYSKKEFSNY